MQSNKAGYLLSEESFLGSSGDELLLLCKILFLPVYGDGATAVVACVL